MDCDPKIVTFAILGAMKGDVQPKGIAQILSNYLVSGIRQAEGVRM